MYDIVNIIVMLTRNAYKTFLSTLSSLVSDLVGAGVSLGSCYNIYILILYNIYIYISKYASFNMMTLKVKLLKEQI